MARETTRQGEEAGSSFKEPDDDLQSTHGEGEDIIGNVDVTTATVGQLTTYIRTKIIQYHHGIDIEEALFDIFAEDFETWTTEVLKKVDGMHIRQLKDALESKGVTMPPTPRFIADKLAFVLKQERMDPWPQGKEVPIAVIAAKKAQSDNRLRDSEWRQTLIEQEIDRNIEITRNAMTPAKTPSRLLFKTPIERRQQQPQPATPIGQRDPTPEPQVQQPQVQFSTIPTSRALLPSQLPYQQPQQTISSLSSKIANYSIQGNIPQITTLIKLYNNPDHKYSGSRDVFDQKLNIFLTYCKQSAVPQHGLLTAFPNMLKNEALDYYFANQLRFGTLPLEDIIQIIKDYFEGPQHKLNILQQWNAVSFETVVAEHKEKTCFEQFNILADKLRQLNQGLPESMQTDETIYNKLLLACETTPTFQFACQNKTLRLSDFITNLRAAAAAKDRTSKTTLSAELMMTDRRYKTYGNRRGQYRDKDKPYYREKGREGGRGRDNHQGRRNNKCWVCSKETCRSWKHTKEEQERAKELCPPQYRHFLIDEEDNDDEAYDTEASSIEDTTADKAEVYLTTYGPVQGRDLFQSLANVSALHALGQTVTSSIDDINTPLEASTYSYTPDSGRYNDRRFEGILVDTGAAFASTAGYGQYLALKKLQDITIDKNTDPIQFKFGIGMKQSIGSIRVKSPLGILTFYVIEADTPFLLSLGDLDKMKIYYNNVTNQLVSKEAVWPIVRKFGHPFLVWDTTLVSYCTEVFLTADNYPVENQLTEQELRQLHRRFGHPSVDRLAKLLSQSNHDFNKEQLSKITQYCDLCQKHGKAPGRFKFTIKDDVQFNYSVIIDIMYIGEPSAPVLHAVDEATRFQAARFLKDVSAQHVWDTLRTMWMDTYLGPPDMIVHDAGTQFTSLEFIQTANTMGSNTKCVPVEAHHSIGTVERYHAPLRRAYDIIQKELPKTHKQFVLQMAVKAINDTAGPGGLVPTLLVFGAYPRMSITDTPAPSITDRNKAIRKAMKEVAELYAKRQVTDALRQRNGPKTDSILDAAVGDDVLVWREGKGWQGPYMLLSTDDQTCTVKLSSGPTHFRITSVKKYHTEEEQVNQSTDQSTDQRDESYDTQEIQSRPTRNRQMPSRYREDIHITQKESDSLKLAIRLRQEGIIRTTSKPFIKSRQQELEGLLNQGVFRIVDINNIPPNERLFGSRFVDDIKYKDGQPYEKSRLVVQAHHDTGKKEVLTQSPTIQRVSQRIILCFTVVLNRDLYLRDISQAYIQSETNLNRKFFIKPPKEINLGDTVVLEVLRPLYGVPEAGTHWFNTYHKHHTEKLNLQTSSYDHCLLYNKEAIVGLQTDDTLFAATKTYVKQEEEQLQAAKYLAKPVEKLTISLQFNGGKITRTTNGIVLSQEKQCAKIQVIDINNLKATYIKERARGAYIASTCQPEAAFALSFAAQTTEPTKADAEQLNKCLKWQKDNQTRGIQFVRLNLSKLKLYVFVDASFANNKDFSSQIGYILVLANETQVSPETISIKGNTLHWSSTKCKRVTRSVLAAELYAMVAGFDIASVIQQTMEKLAEEHIPVVICTDSFSLYDCLTKLSTTAEKRLMIDIMGIRQSYERREIDEFKWIDSDSNPADAMTKHTACKALQRLVDTNELELHTKGWVERS